MTSLDDTIAAVAAQPDERTGHCALADRLAEEYADPLAAARDLVRADREADWPRAVFAELCERTGERARAEFIRVQLEIGRFPASSRDAPDINLWLIIEGGNLAGAPAQVEFVRAKTRRLMDLRQRERELIEAGAAQCWDGKDIPLLSLGVIFELGFAAAVACTASEWLAHGDAMCREQPALARVRFTTRPVGDWWDNGARLLVDRPRGIHHDRWPDVVFEVPAEIGRGVYTRVNYDPTTIQAMIARFQFPPVE